MSFTTIRCLAMLTLTALSAAPLAAQEWVFGTSIVNEEAVLLANDRITSDVLGYGLDFDGFSVVAGAPFGSYSGRSQPGRAFVFKRTDGVWGQQQKLIPSTLQNSAWFGIATAVDGRFIAIGAPGEDVAAQNSGAVYIFDRNDGRWQETDKLTAPDPGESDQFGSSVSIDGDTLFVGARFASTELDFVGAVYVYQRIGETWNFTQKLTASDQEQGADFGTKVAVDGDTALVTAIDADVQGVSDAGAVYVFHKTGGTWQEVARLEPQDPQFEAEFGMGISLENDTAVVGAPKEDSRGENGGATYVFSRAGGAWDLTERLVANDVQAGDFFGEDVSINQGRILIGAYLASPDGGGVGQAYLYRRGPSGWAVDLKLLPNVPNSGLLGWTVALVGDRAALSVPFHSLNVGAVYVFNGLGDCDSCDMNCDGSVNAFDIEPFLEILFNGAQPCGACTGDVNGDGAIDAFDIEPFLSCLFP